MTYYFEGRSGESFTDKTLHADYGCPKLGESVRLLAESSVTAEQPRCPECTDTEDTCEVVKADDEVCGRERPCPYHD